MLVYFSHKTQKNHNPLTASHLTSNQPSKRARVTLLVRGSGRCRQPGDGLVQRRRYQRLVRGLDGQLGQIGHAYDVGRIVQVADVLLRELDVRGVGLRNVDDRSRNGERCQHVLQVGHGTDVHRSDSGQHLAVHAGGHREGDVPEVDVRLVGVVGEKREVHLLFTGNRRLCQLGGS